MDFSYPNVCWLHSFCLLEIGQGLEGGFDVIIGCLGQEITVTESHAKKKRKSAKYKGINDLKEFMMLHEAGTDSPSLSFSHEQEPVSWM